MYTTKSESSHKFWIEKKYTNEHAKTMDAEQNRQIVFQGMGGRTTLISPGRDVHEHRHRDEPGQREAEHVQGDVQLQRRVQLHAHLGFLVSSHEEGNKKSAGKRSPVKIDKLPSAAALHVSDCVPRPQITFLGISPHAFLIRKKRAKRFCFGVFTRGGGGE